MIEGILSTVDALKNLLMNGFKTLNEELWEFKQQTVGETEAIERRVEARLSTLKQKVTEIDNFTTRCTEGS